MRASSRAATATVLSGGERPVSRARVLLFRELGGFVALAHDREAIARPHDALDFRNLVSGQNNELSRLGTHGLVLGEGEAHCFHAARVPALTQEVKAPLDSFTALEVLNMLVDLAEEHLVPANPFLSLRHRTIMALVEEKQN